jgi:two-component sensor histidine kinase
VSSVRSPARQPPKIRKISSSASRSASRHFQPVRTCSFGTNGRGVDIEDLVRTQLALFASLIDSRIAVRGPRLRLKPEAAQSIGLALHELATNAGKYGALSNNKGRIDIWWQATANMFTMSWTENEGPPVVTPTRRGFGSTVISTMAKHSLDGEVALYYARSGLMWRLTCPAANALEPQEREGNQDKHRSS